MQMITKAFGRQMHRVSGLYIYIYVDDDDDILHWSSMTNTRLHIAVAHAAFLGGGAEAVTLWTIQALQEAYSVSLFTLLEIDLDELNARYGTSINKSRVRQVAVWKRSWITQKLYMNLSLFTLRQEILGRKVRQMKEEFSLVVSTYNELDMGTPGLQYVHSPFFGSYSSSARKILNFPDSRMRRLIKTVIGYVCGTSGENINRNISVTNSKWTASLLKNNCNIDADVLYPPVEIGAITCGEVEPRRKDFLCVGRFGRDKKIETAIAIMDRVRAQGVDVHLKVAGHTHDKKYMEELEELRQSRAKWLTFEKNVSRERLITLLSEYEFGLQPREAEQFGIAVAEMAALGCIPFVPKQGGQAEIVDDEPLLTFSDIEDAAEKVARVYRSPELREALRCRLIASRYRFSPETFMEGIRRSVVQSVAALYQKDVTEKS